MKKQGGVLITVRDSDKKEIGDIARQYEKLGFQLFATEGTARVLTKQGLSAQPDMREESWSGFFLGTRM